MHVLTENFDLEQFWQELRRAPRALLLLDFDGTLSPFVSDPAMARPYPGVVELLQQLAELENNRLVIVSGRDLGSLSACLGLDPAPELWGCHGWQRCLPGGHMLQRQPADKYCELLDQAAGVAVSAGFGRHLEIKPVSLALHWRGLELSVAELMREQVGKRWRELIGGEDVLLTEFDGGIELRSPELTKGTAVGQLLCEENESAAIAYLGDDLTDEDAFAELGGRGLKVLVRSQLRDSAADLWLQPPDELLWFLRQWLVSRGGKE